MLQDLYMILAKHFKLSSDEIAETRSSGNQTLLVNRVGWARRYLDKAGLNKVVRRTVFQITEKGIDIKYLEKVSIFYCSFYELGLFIRPIYLPHLLFTTREL
ncbi:winged helix-turn-helix domain-containing protein [Bacillus sp. 1P10SD]|uniref:winged helix-turn-helix domain-containing protein n=1 Tax=Bacillus sp. 1P10SD TaxID=3132265 RepID=UPI0039A579D8